MRALSFHHIGGVLKNNLPIILLAATLFLFISKSLYNVPIAVMAFMGLYQSIVRPAKIVNDSLIQLYVLVFLCLWLPLMLSLTDAVNPERATKTTLSYLRFLFMGVYLIQGFRTAADWSRIKLVIFWLVTFWSLDACLQLITGKDLFGYPLVGGHVTGMFYPRYTIAHIIAGLSPVYFEVLREKSSRYNYVWILLIPLFLVVFLSGRRGTWLMLLVAAGGYLYYLYKQKLMTPHLNKALIVVGLAGMLSIIGTMTFYPPMKQRLSNTMLLFSGEYEQIDNALSARLPIWEASIVMFKENWLNGVGPRGFRYAYDQYSSGNDVWYGKKPAHPHQMYLEILVETGIIGLIGFLTALYFFLVNIIKKRLIKPVMPSMLSLLVIAFPINTHMAFYSSYWSSFFWWLLIFVFLHCSISLRINEGNASDGH